MEFNYNLGEYDDPYFRFNLDTGHYLLIDVAKKFPDYKLVRNRLADKIWDFTLIESADNKNIGDIKGFEYKNIKHLNACPKILKFRSKVYRKSKQTELDKYLYKTNPDTDNGKLYKYVYDILEEYYKKNSIKETVV